MPKKITRTRYATYSRCSTDDQAHKDFSTIDVQRDLNKEYIQAKGGELAGSYEDQGISGTTLARPGWKRMLADAQSGLFNVVVITYMSRLGRGDTCTVAEYLLKEAGVKVEMVNEHFTDDVAGYVNRTMTRFVDGMYVENVRQWTKTKMEAMVKAGYHCGCPAFGFTLVADTDGTGFHRAGKEPPKRLVPQHGSAEIVTQAFALYAETGQLAKVREYLNSVTSRTWTTTSTKNLLSNEAYRGVQQFGGWRNETSHLALIDVDTWEIVQTRSQTQAARYAKRHTDDFTYYLQGRVVCPNCGCGFTHAAHHGRGGKTAHYYVCQAANRRAKGGAECPRPRLNADRLHRTVLDYFQHVSTHRTAMHKLIAQSGGWSSADEAQKALRGQLGKQKQAVEMRIANYVKAIGEGRDSVALMTALDKAEAERESVIEQMARIDLDIEAAKIQRPTAADVSEGWSRAMEVWTKLDEEERTQLMGAMVQKVEYTDKESVTLEMLPFTEATFTSHSQCFALTYNLGAGVGLEPTTFGL